MKNISSKNKGGLAILFFMGLFFIGITYLQGAAPWGFLIPLSALGMIISMGYTSAAIRKEKSEVKPPANSNTTE